jgi:hypothetical protein
MKIYKFCLAVSTSILVNCSANLKVYSDPEYATIYVNGQNFGRTPFDLNYKINREDKKNGFIYIGELNARWLSGAETSEKIKMDLSRDGLYQEVTLKRPKEYPNIQLDVNYVQERTTKQVEIKK